MNSEIQPEGKMSDLKESIGNLFDLAGENLKELNELHKQDNFIQEQIAEFKELSGRINMAIGILDDYFAELEVRIEMLEKQEFSKGFDTISREIEWAIQKASKETNAQWQNFLKAEKRKKLRLKSKKKR